MVSGRALLGITGAAAAMLAAGAALPACDLVLGIPERTLDAHVVCTDGACACGDGFADCDGDMSNGCEADLSKAATCGACGNDCRNGACEAGVCKCQSGFADCDGKPENGCEAALEMDGEHCGSCGRGCLGGTCQGGVCQPIVVATLSEPDALALGAGSLYVASCDPPPLIAKIAAGGALVNAIGDAGAIDCAEDMVIAGPTLFWVSNDGIYQNPLGTSANPTQLASGVSVDAFAAGPPAAYWYDIEAMALQRVSVMGGAVETISTLDVSAIVADADNVYFSDGDSLYSVAHTGTTVTTLGALSAFALAVDAHHLYFSDDESIQSVPLAGGAPTTLTPAGSVLSMTVDASAVYWADFDAGTINKVPLAGGTPTVLATGQSTNGARMVVDAQAVYWIANSQVLKVPK